MASTSSRKSAKGERGPSRSSGERPSATTIRLTGADRRAAETLIDAGWARNLSQAITLGLHLAVERIKAQRENGSK